MKERKIYLIYLIIMILEVVMILTKGFDTNVLIYSYIDGAEVADGQSIEIYLSIFNTIIFFLILVVSAIITFNKNNEIKYKKIILFLIILLSLFIDCFVYHITGGIAGENSYYKVGLWYPILNFFM